MTTFRAFLADTIREYFAIPRISHETQVAASTWQRFQLPHNLALLPGYQPGQYARSYHLQLERAIQNATGPYLSRITTTPLVARDIERASTPPIEDDDDTTERRPAIKRQTTSTQEIPAINAEIMLMEMMRGPVSPHDTGEQAPVRIGEDAF